MTDPTHNTRPEVDEDDGPCTSVPNRLLALLIEADHCLHVPDYVCGACALAARDALLSLLEGPHWSEPARPAEKSGSAHPAPHPQGGTDKVRLDGYPTDEDAAAGYMSHVGYFRMAMRDAVEAIDVADLRSARAVLVRAEGEYKRDTDKRHDAIAPVLAAAGLVRNANGSVSALLAAAPAPTE